MEKDWAKIRVYTNAIEAEIVRQMLVENNIPAVVLNKQDSSYHFGKLELYVAEENKETALALMDQDNNNNTEDDNVN